MGKGSSTGKTFFGMALMILVPMFLHAHDPLHVSALLDNRSDDSAKVIVRSITINGNHQTKSSIILRELPFRTRDTIPKKKFEKWITEGRENIFNTTLFNFVTVNTLPSGGSQGVVDVVIIVVERWYIWPWPFFEISDRNFNSWAETFDFSRLTYGIDLTIKNVRGRNETLKFPIHFGFNQKLGFGYKMPYLNRRKTLGISFGTEANRNHEVIVGTHENRPVYYKDPGHFPRKNLFAFFDLLWRPTFFSKHTLHLEYNGWYFSDSLLQFPGYAPGNRNYLNYVSLAYRFRNDKRDVQFYPLKGSYFDLMLVQNGLPNEAVNEFYMKAELRGYVQMYRRWYFAAGFTGKLTLTPDPPFFMQSGLGYGRDYVRGYEYYVIDAGNFMILKTNFKFAIVPQRDFSLDFIRSIKFNRVPYAVYVNIICDAGYGYSNDPSPDKTNTLQNSLLVGYGAGLDFTTYYDVVLRLEAVMNGIGKPGLYLHFTAPI